MASPDALLALIQGIHQAMPLFSQALAEHPDPQAKQIIGQCQAAYAKCLADLLKLQGQDHQNANQLGGAAQQVASALGGR